MPGMRLQVDNHHRGDGFFRLGSSWFGEHQDGQSLVSNLAYMDYSTKEFLEDAFLISHWSNGGFCFQDCKDMEFDDFMEVHKLARQVMQNAEKAAEGVGNADRF